MDADDFHAGALPRQLDDVQLGILACPGGVVAVEACGLLREFLRFARLVVDRAPLDVVRGGGGCFGVSLRLA
jgi:hypothetical protein